MKTLSIDLNCDLGEGFGAWGITDDEALLPFVSSINVACGFHAGDHNIMHATVKAAVKHKVAIGAHPGFQDLMGFGRRDMDVSVDEIYNLVMYQIGALQSFTHAYGVQLHHVKPHGALYNIAAQDKERALAIAHAVKDATHSDIILYGLSGSTLITAAQSIGLKAAHEVFADRRYGDDGYLVARGTAGAMIESEATSLAQVLQMVQTGSVTTINNKILPTQSDTICIHGDGPHAINFLKSVRRSLMEHKITISAPK